MLAERLGMASEQQRLIARAAPLHDVGKIAIPDAILLKPGKLSDEEFEVVKTHALLGARVLAGAVIGNRFHRHTSPEGATCRVWNAR